MTQSGVGITGEREGEDLTGDQRVVMVVDI